MRRVVGYYLVSLFIVVCGYWIATLSGGGVDEGRFEIGFHVFSEILMAVLCLIGGLLLIRKHRLGAIVASIGMGMVLYSVLNAAGYFGEQQEWGMVGMFLTLFIVTTALFFALVFKK